jgi:hypothetical protein
MSDVQEYTDAVAAQMNKGGFIPDVLHDTVVWEALARGKLTDAVLSHAANVVTPKFVNILAKHGISEDVAQRTQKTKKRILSKLVEAGARVADGDPLAHFKVNSDLCAIRVHTAMDNIGATMRVIYAAVVSEPGGKCWLRDYDAIVRNKDIVGFVFAYIPALGFVIEVQVGHPFALYAFKLNSEMRNAKHAGDTEEELMGMLNLFHGKFYTKVKRQLLREDDPESTLAMFQKQWPAPDIGEAHPRLLVILRGIDAGNAGVVL